MAWTKTRAVLSRVLFWKKKLDNKKQVKSQRLKTIHGALVRIPRRMAKKPPHRRKASGFSFYEMPTWTYRDRYSYANVTNGLITAHSFSHHLILRDGTGTPRFTLAWKRTPMGITIWSVQRERTQYEKVSEGFFEWLADKENVESKKFKEKLGMHPSEFLLSEFIYRNREEIRKGGKIFLNGRRNTTRALVDRFCEKKPANIKWDNSLHALSLQKRRVKEILAMP